jgi:hypothetical protein
LVVAGCAVSVVVSAAGVTSVATAGISPLHRSTAAVPVLSACSLLAPNDLHAVLGGAVSDGTLTAAPDESETICGWVVTTSSARGFGVQLDVHKQFSAAEFKQQRGIATGKTTTVRHLGDAAFFERAVVAGRVFDDLWVRKAPVAFRIEVLKAVGAKPLRKLAAFVLSNLAHGA